MCTPPIARHACISVVPDYHATSQNEEMWLHMIAAASWLLAAPQLGLAAAAVAVIGSTVEEPVPSNISAFTITLHHRILRHAPCDHPDESHQEHLCITCKGPDTTS